jgi:Tfp pilus assembly protein PilX
MPLIARIRTRLADTGGFTMIIALGVMLVTSLLLVAVFTATNGDVKQSHRDTVQKQAYFAAVAGLQEYEHQLQANADYWETTCTGPSGEVPGEAEKKTKQFYATAMLGANGLKCSTANPFGSMIESKGANANTFRIESTGTVEGVKRSMVATFRVSGFLDYAYFTQYEDEDPYLSGEEECERYYEEAGHSTRSSKCGNITFTHEDSVYGPMHTDDSALVECSNKVTFGREGEKGKPHEPPDAVEINRGTWSTKSTKAKKANESPCPEGERPVYNTAENSKKEKTFSEEGAELKAPPSDTSLKAYVESGYEFVGRTKLVLEGENITVTNANFHGGTATSVKWPGNGLIFVRNGSAGCKFEYSNKTPGSDTTATYEKEAECGSVYVKGTYTKSLTVGAETDLIVNGSIVPTGVSEGSPPSGTVTMGLMATRFVRVYHPCVSSHSGSTEEGIDNIWIYAAILSTSHSFLVDNSNCGEELGNLNVYGAIAQKFRGVVGTTGGTGYFKDYKYDERLATDEPPYFLAPLGAGWQIARETAPTGG